MGDGGRDVTYTVATDKAFDDAVRAVEEATARRGFRVLHVHDVAQTLRDKGFEHEPLKIVEICSARYASQVLAEDIEVSAFLPCRVSVYRDGGKTYLSALRPEVIAQFFPGPTMEAVAAEVGAIVVAIVDEAR
jgi:uncharacterized protein (DUF302 family)